MYSRSWAGGRISFQPRIGLRWHCCAVVNTVTSQREITVFVVSALGGAPPGDTPVPREILIHNKALRDNRKTNILSGTKRILVTRVASATSINYHSSVNVRDFWVIFHQVGVFARNDLNTSHQQLPWVNLLCYVGLSVQDVHPAAQSLQIVQFYFWMNEGPSFKNSERLQHLRIPALMKSYPKHLQTINTKHAAVDDLWPLQQAESKSGQEGGGGQEIQTTCLRSLTNLPLFTLTACHFVKNKARQRRFNTPCEVRLKHTQMSDLNKFDK